jgi:hypothetical protein
VNHVTGQAKGQAASRRRRVRRAEEPSHRTATTCARRCQMCGTRLITTTLAALVLAELLGACSDDTASSSDDDGNAQEDAAFDFARCMRDNGIENYPDPQISGNGTIQFPNPAGVGFGELEAAREACRHILVAAGPGGPQPDTTVTVAVAWERIAPGGDCQCSDGSEFSFWVREADPKKVVLFFKGGGVCFSAETCSPESDLYNPRIGPEDDPARRGGIFDFADERNPFADYSVIYVPYCTGDVHIGNATTAYEPGLTVHHKGYVNGTAALDHLVDAFPRATDVVVMGESAGSVAAPLYAGLVSDRLPDASITVLADGSGAYPHVPATGGQLGAAWGTGNTIPAWPENAGPTAEQWSAPNLFIQSGRHDPGIVFARHDYAYDHDQTAKLPLVFDIPSETLVSLIDANETQIESAGVNLLSYIAPGDASPPPAAGRPPGGRHPPGPP